MAWQCTAAEIDCYRPPTAQNWAFGCWAIFEGDGVWGQFNEFISPKSLLRGQLEIRLGAAAGDRIGDGVVHPPGSTRPSVEQAQQMVAASSGPAPQLTDVIDRWIAEHPLPTDGSEAAVLDPASVPSDSQAEALLPLKLENGWLTIGGALAVGGRMEGGPSVWDLVMAGGSLPSSLPGASRELLTAIPKMQPADLVGSSNRASCLAEPGRQYLVTSSGGSTFDLDLSQAAGEFEARWLSPNRSGPSTAEAQSVHGGTKVSFTAPESGDAMLWLTKIDP
jgi:hypothetical protein